MPSDCDLQRVASARIPVLAIIGRDESAAQRSSKTATRLRQQLPEADMASTSAASHFVGSAFRVSACLPSAAASSSAAVTSRSVAAAFPACSAANRLVVLIPQRPRTDAARRQQHRRRQNHRQPPPPTLRRRLPPSSAAAFANSAARNRSCTPTR